MNILVFTTLWPNGEQPDFGVFVRHRMRAVAGLAGVRMRVVAPVPYFPRWLQGSFIPSEWQRKARIPERETTDGLIVEHPRYLVTPKVGMRHYGQWMARGALATLRRLHAEEPIDLIDAHFIYPDGYAAVLLGRALNLPVVLSARGSDINVFTKLPAIRPLISEALGEAAGIIAVSAGLQREMVALGIPAASIAVIRNGIDRERFSLRDRAAARRRLGLSEDHRILVTVGRLEPLKRIDLLLDAMALLRQQATTHDALLYVIGDGSEGAQLRARIARHGLQDRVFLTGAKPQAELPDWYAAADLFCFASRSEGCPNVLLEALGCGLPVLAPDIAGIDEILTDTDCGVLVAAEPSPAAGFAAGIISALDRKWDRAAIAATGGARSWQDVAVEVKQYLSQTVARHDNRAYS